jgi:hypothetical protein
LWGEEKLEMEREGGYGTELENREGERAIKERKR